MNQQPIGKNCFYAFSGLPSLSSQIRASKPHEIEQFYFSRNHWGLRLLVAWWHACLSPSLFLHIYYLRVVHRLHVHGQGLPKEVFFKNIIGESQWEVFDNKCGERKREIVGAELMPNQAGPIWLRYDPSHGAFRRRVVKAGPCNMTPPNNPSNFIYFRLRFCFCFLKRP